MSLISGNGNRINIADNVSTGNSSTAKNPRERNVNQEGYINSTDKNVIVPIFGLNSSGTSSKNVLTIDLAGRLQDDNEHSTSDTAGEADKVPLSLEYQSSFAGASPMRNKSTSNKSIGSTAIDEAKSKENIMYLAKSFKPQTSILPPKSQSRSDLGISERPVVPSTTAIPTANVLPVRTTTPLRTIVPPNAPTQARARAPSVEHQNQNQYHPTSRSAPSFEHQTPSSSSASRPRKDYSSIKFDPVPFPPARVPIESSRTHVSQYDVGEYFTKAITEDRGDGNGYGRRIHLPPVFDPDYFLGDREGVVNALKRFCDEERRMREDEDKTVGHLIEKFQEISPSDYNMIIHRFGFDKIYSISDSVLHIYHPYPSPNSPFKDKRMEEIIEIVVEEDDDDRDTAPKEKSYTVDGALQNVSVSGLKREHGKN
jgi:hypothetical protein